MAKESTGSTNQRWKPKTPAQIVLEQISKQAKKVEKLKEELKTEEQELKKLEKAKQLFESAS